MIASWKEFFIAVEQMRECQKEYFRTKGPLALMAAQKCEAAVDACIKEKRAEWARQKQPELIGGYQ
jgi:predicted GIY-YIG superfamily endonuclease